KFLTREDSKDPDGLSAITRAQLIRVCSPWKEPFKNILKRWAIGDGHGDPMHWHHLSSQSQEAYDKDHKRGVLLGVKSLEKVLALKDHGLTLRQMTERFDHLFSPNDLLVMNRDHALDKNWYSSRVLNKWRRFMEKQSILGIAS